jgi:RecA-family ATPase
MTWFATGIGVAAVILLLRVDTKLNRVLRQGAQIMSKASEIQAILDQIDTATNEVASDIQKLRDDLAGGVTAEEATGIQTRLTVLSDRLTAMGKDPENPAPPVG